AVIEFVEQLDELVAPPGLHLEIVNVKVLALRRQRSQSHRVSLPRSMTGRRLLRFARNDNKGLSLREAERRSNLPQLATDFNRRPGEGRDPPFRRSATDKWIPTFAGTTI